MLGKVPGETGLAWVGTPALTLASWFFCLRLLNIVLGPDTFRASGLNATLFFPPASQPWHHRKASYVYALRSAFMEPAPAVFYDDLLYSHYTTFATSIPKVSAARRPAVTSCDPPSALSALLAITLCVSYTPLCI